jgi:hypothetical protein
MKEIIIPPSSIIAREARDRPPWRIIILWLSYSTSTGTTLHNSSSIATSRRSSQGTQGNTPLASVKCCCNQSHSLFLLLIYIIIMKVDVGSLIKELQDACRQSLYNGMMIGTTTTTTSAKFLKRQPSFSDYASMADTDTGSQTSLLQKNPASKRRRRDEPTNKNRRIPRSWEEVRLRFCK